MERIKIIKYTSDYYQQWNDFVAHSKNATFLFHRDFMEYHQNRFEDYSLLVFQDEKLIALFPANKVDQQIYSHQGLTYGGIVVDYGVRLDKFIAVFQAVLAFYESIGIESIHVKLLPSIYTSFPSEELNYCCFLADAKLLKTDTLAVIDLSTDFSILKNRMEGVNRGVKHGLIVKETDSFDSFWNEILLPNLAEKHKKEPVHSLEEITYLKAKFPNQIRQFNVYFQNQLVAGTTIFESDFVAHSQYIASNSTKNELGSLDFLHHYLLTEVFTTKKFFDFGISNELAGRKLNQGLHYWKESFGARTVVQEVYAIATNKHINCNEVLL